MSTEPGVHGVVAPGFEPVREAFRDVLRGSGTGAGAAFAVYRRGRRLVDLWGGLADPLGGRAWTPGTLTVLFSGTKGVAATVVGMLAGQGRLDPDRRVSEYWPEFAAAGKGDLRVHHVLAHTAGLPYVEPEPSDRLDNVENAALLAEQTPLWPPGERVAYHALTYGYLVTELLRRVRGSSVGSLVRELLTEAHRLDLHLGSPPPGAEVARIVRSADYRVSTFLRDERRRAIVDRMYGTMLFGELVNSAEYRRAQLSSAGALGTARSMARLYDLLAAGRLLDPGYLRAATRTWSEGPDAINDRPVRFGLGYELADPIGTYGPAAEAFGHSGAGGGRHGAWPAAELGLSFVTNELYPEDRDRRAATLLDVLWANL